MLTEKEIRIIKKRTIGKGTLKLNQSEIENVFAINISSEAVFSTGIETGILIRSIKNTNVKKLNSGVKTKIDILINTLCKFLERTFVHKYKKEIMTEVISKTIRPSLGIRRGIMGLSKIAIIANVKIHLLFKDWCLKNSMPVEVIKIRTLSMVKTYHILRGLST